MRSFSIVFILLYIFVTMSVFAQSVGPAFLPDQPALPASSPPMRLAETLISEPQNRLRPASEAAVDQIETLAAWNRAGRLPVRIGFARPLPIVERVVLNQRLLESADFSDLAGGIAARSLRGTLVWGTAVEVQSAYRLRLKLSDVQLPESSRLWVYGLGDMPLDFSTENLDQSGDLWTPSVGGDWLFLEVEIPSSLLGEGIEYGFELTEVAELVQLDEEEQPRLIPYPAPVGECLIDATCIDTNTLDVIELYRHAVAHLEFIENGSVFVCSGGLLNDTDVSTDIPYLLTANHCFSTQSTTSSLEAFWEYRTSTCFGQFPNLNGVPRSSGGMLLASSSQSDFTLVRLNAIPSGRALLGWTATQSAVVEGTVVHRLSHPVPGNVAFPQAYSRSIATFSTPACNGVPRPNFIYSRPVNGGVYGGSSGSPVILPGGFVVGQLLGQCGPVAGDGCNYANRQVDGAFSATFPAIQQWLAPPTSNTDPCIPSDTTLCIDDVPGDKRFEVRVAYQTTQGGGSSGMGHAVSLSSLNIRRGGLFWFFNATNPELLIKVLNACVPVFGNRFWVFYSAGTNIGLTIEVRDTVGGQTLTYNNTDGTPAPPRQDTTGFPCNP